MKKSSEVKPFLDTAELAFSEGTQKGAFRESQRQLFSQKADLGLALKQTKHIIVLYTLLGEVTIQTDAAALKHREMPKGEQVISV